MGCLISESKDENSGKDIYLRACTDRSSFECADYQGDEGGDFHECVCQGEGCNKDWTTAGDTSDETTTDNPVTNVRIFKEFIRFNYQMFNSVTFVKPSLVLLLVMQKTLDLLSPVHLKTQ